MSEIVAIVGSRLKFWTDRDQRAIAHEHVYSLVRLTAPDAIIVSGDCPYGGVDRWARIAAEKIGRKYEGHPPSKYLDRGYSFRIACAMRDRDIAERCTILNAVYPAPKPTPGTAKTIGFAEEFHKTVQRFPIPKGPGVRP